MGRGHQVCVCISAQTTRRNTGTVHGVMGRFDFVLLFWNFNQSRVRFFVCGCCTLCMQCPSGFRCLYADLEGLLLPYREGFDTGMFYGLIRSLVRRPWRSSFFRLVSLSSPPPPLCILPLPPYKYANTGGRMYWNHFVRLSICPSVVPSVCPIVSAQYLLNRTAQPLFVFLPNLVRWCIITRRCVMRKNWFTVFNVKVTARVI